MKKQLLLLLVLCFAALQGARAQGPTVINMSTITGDIAITPTGYTMGGVAMEAALNPAGYELTGTTSTRILSVDSALTTKLIFNNLTMNSRSSTVPWWYDATMIDVSGANVTIELASGSVNTLTSNHGNTNCINKDGMTGELHIMSPDGTGKLYCYANVFHSGCITSHVKGCGHGHSDRNGSGNSFTNFYFESGYLEVSGGPSHNPGIGASCKGDTPTNEKITKNINILGGTLIARGGQSCPGIGGGAGTPVDGIYISNGAKVIAYGGQLSPAIGSGGTVTIGFGTVAGDSNFSVNDIQITGDSTTVTAYGDAPTNMPGIGMGKNYDNNYGLSLHTMTNVLAIPKVGWQGYVKYGTSATQFAYSDTLPKTPFPATEEFGTFLDSMARVENAPVFYTQVYFGPFKTWNAIDTLAEIGANHYCYPIGGKPLTESLLNAAFNISGHDENGNRLEASDFSVANGRMVQAQIDSLNNAVKKGITGSYPITYTYIYNAPSDGLPDTLQGSSFVMVVDVDKTFGIKNNISKPFKVNQTRTLTLDIDPDFVNSLTNIEWTFEEPPIITGSSKTPTVKWTSTGVKHGTVKASYTSIDPSTGNVTSSCELYTNFRIVVLPENVVYMAGPGQPNKVGVDDDEKSDDELYNEGRVWEDPLNLKDALQQASQGDVILVPEGTYTPSKGTSFVIDCDSVTIIGGAQGWETSASEVVTSKPEKTIISGNGSSAVVVQLGAAVGACGITTATRLEGLVIQGGTAIAGENGSDGNGGGIYFKNGTSATIAHCIVKGNSASENGGGIYTTKYAGCGTCSDPILYNVEISGNRAKQGAGMYNELSSPMLTNVTIGGNAASISGAGVYNNATDSAKFRNTIIYGNVTGGVALEDEFVNDGGTPRISYSLISGCKGSGDEWNTTFGADGSHNVDKNPIYLRGGYTDAGALREGNYRIVPQSPAYNHGYNAYVNNIPLDLDAQDRIYSDIVDMGAYEYHDGDEKKLQHEVVIGTYDHVTTVPPMGVHYADAHVNYTVTFYPKDGYSLQYMTITTGSDLQDNQGGMIKTMNPDGSVTVIFQEVSEPLDIKIGGVSPTANEAIEGMTTMWANGGNLYVQVSKPQMLNIYTAGGMLYKTQQVGIGETVVPMEQGLYIVTLANGTKQKIVIK